MKCFLLFVLIACSIGAMSQIKTFDLDCCACTLETILEKFQAKTGITYSCQRELLNKAPRLCLKLKNVTAEIFKQVLADSLPQFEFLLGDGLLSFNRNPGFKARPVRQANTGNKNELTGTISGESGRPLEYSTVKIKRGQETTANATGNFSIQVQPNDTLIISHIGYGDYVLPWQGQNRINIRLEIPLLDPTTVSGYLGGSKRSNTASIVSISGDKLHAGNTADALRQASGLLVTALNGIPGGTRHISIRGTNSIGLTLGTTPSDDPLIIVNGVALATFNQPLNQMGSVGGEPGAPGKQASGLNSLFLINPEDIDSITVLKDAAATAIYGSRGANGVIIIRTKKAKITRPTVTIASFVGMGKATYIMPMMNTAQYADLRTNATENAGWTPSSFTLPDIYPVNTNRNTNFGRSILGNTSYFNGQQVTFARGDTSKQLLFGYSNYLESSSLSRDVKTQRSTLMADFGVKTSDGKLRFNFTGYHSQINANWIIGDLLRGQLLAPHIPLFDSAGNRIWEVNGLSFNNYTGYFHNKLDIHSSNYLLHTALQYKLSSNIKLESSVGYQGLNTDEKGVVPMSGQNPSGNGRASMFKGQNDYHLFTPELQLHVNKSWKNFYGDFLLGTSAIIQENKRTAQTLGGYFNDSVLGDPVFATERNSTSATTKYRFVSLFARGQFGYQNKYFLDLGFRVDGSSRFGPKKRYAPFPSTGASAILYEAKPDSITRHLISFVKMRSSYGITGNDQIGDYAWLNAWYREIASPSNPGDPGISPSRLYNGNYKWQQTEKIELALEMGFFNNKANMVAAVFRNRTTNQLINYSLPSQVGFTTMTTNFPAVVQNLGFEWEFRSNLGNKYFASASTLSLSHMRNKLLRFPGLERSAYANSLVVGQSLSVQRGWLYGGVDPETGLFKLADSSRRVIGNKDAPFFGALHQVFSFKCKLKLEFLVDWRISKATHYMAYIYNYLPAGQLNETLLSNQPTELVNRWRQPGDRATWQKVSAAPEDQTEQAIANWINSSAQLTDASFIRCRYMRVSYSTEKALQRWHIKKLSFFVMVQNLFTIKSFPALDPETPDPFVLPPTRNVSAGINVSL